MKITKTLGHVFLEEAVCDCGGKLKTTSKVSKENPIGFIHKCEKCGKTDKFRNEYPSYNIVVTKE